MTGNAEAPQLVAHLPRCWKPRHRDDLVRLGPKQDGGYVVTEAIIRHTDFVVGLGVGTDWNFEEDFHERKRCPVHCYDHTISLGRFTMDALRHSAMLLVPPRLRNIGRFYEPVNLLPLKYISFFRGDKKHYREKIGGDAARDTDFRKIFSRIPEGDKVFVKIDIEGGEYSLLSGLGEYYERVTGLVVEFHHIIFHRDLIGARISALRRSFDIVHVHVNNFKGIDERGMPYVFEVTFENKNLGNGDGKESEREYPVVGLDYPNSTWFADFKLLFEAGI